ncbi:AarF/ABC1/UbiB kinase family protein [Terasakiella sp. A23]|uniref:ABC1 kinase family protein n=1 Tax=Terasakiella sp. FCG-A23 TaxID=3080561 RepID=UPI002954D146|nr:AarF/ABC1/UbiB kinase family protein [Terasakiella sp. A23]MDV7339569.1 AarF/ABC1/UbiB kinase family protein [Terasakiella sp. A23]
MREDNRFLQRVKRYGHVGMSAGKMATTFAGQRLKSSDIFTQTAAQELRKALGGLKGPIMKVAQIMATIPDALPEEFAKELSQLQCDAPPMGWPFVKRRMNKELGANWQQRFKQFDRDSSYAASLGQVHQARSLEGEKLVCKLQYPDMSSAIEADLNQLKLMFSIYRRYDKAIDTTNILAELSERLREELDYTREAKSMQIYGEMLSGEENIHVPTPIQGLSTDRLLTMTYLPGNPLIETAEKSPEICNTIATSLFKAWYIPLYRYGIIHGDPHLGNYTVREDGSVNLLDFGCIRFFKADFVSGIIDLYNAIRTNDKDKAIHAYESWGFENLSHDIIDILNRWAHYIYTPLLEDKTRHIHDSDNGLYGAKVANEIHQELKERGGIRPPREFVMVDRAAIGLGSVFMRTRAEVNWHRLFHELIDDFNAETLTANQKQLLDKVDLTLT